MEISEVIISNFLLIEVPLVTLPLPLLVARKPSPSLSALALKSLRSRPAHLKSGLRLYTLYEHRQKHPTLARDVRRTTVYNGTTDPTDLPLPNNATAQCERVLGRGGGSTTACIPAPARAALG